MIRGLAFVPAAPLLIEGLGGRADVLAPLRAHSRAAVTALGDGPLVVLGAGPENRWFAAGPAGPTGWGGAAPGTGGGMPPALAVGGWLAPRADRLFAVAADGTSDGAVLARAGLDGAALAGAGLVVVGDGSACRGPRAPLPDDPRGEAYDRAVVAVLAGGDPADLLALDPALGAALGVSGLPAWRAAARLAGLRPWRARVLTAGAPLGVGYAVAVWDRPAD